MRSFLRVSASIFTLGCAIAATAPTSALAQATANEAAQADDGAATNSDIVVTGSRVIRNGDQAPQPITVVQTADLLNTQPTTVADGLNSLPVFAGSRGPGSTTGPGTGNGGNGAANQLNLRNLGAQRNLILLDGIRVPPALYSGVVDIDIIPETLLQRVDVVTGGASAVYGSDAVSGVVNFVIDRKYKGFKADVMRGISDRGDASQYKVSVAGGTDLFDGRGHIEGSYTRFQRDPLFFKTDRYFAYDYAYGGNGSATGLGTASNPYILFTNTRVSSTSFGGVIRSGPLAGKNFATNGVLSPFNLGTPTGASNLAIGGQGAYNNGSLGASQLNDQAFGRFDYDLTDTTHFFVQGLFVRKQNTSWQNYTQLTNYVISSCNAFLTSAQQMDAGCTATAAPTFQFSKYLAEAPRLRSDVDTKQYFVNGGLDGTIGAFDWGAAAGYGWTTLFNTISGNPNNQRLSAAMDAVVNPANGQIVCRVTLTDPTLAPGCVPYNPFGPSAASAAAISYIQGSTSLWVKNTNFVSNLHVGGELFDLGAGPARFAVTGEYRTQSYQQSVDFGVNDFANCGSTTTGLRYNCVRAGGTTPQTTLYQVISANRSKVTQEVKEASAEVNIPLLRDSAFGKALELNGAVRYTDYDTSGSYWTWKGGINYEPVEGLRLRSTISRDIRAPTLYDLYQAPTRGIANNPDLLTNAVGIPTVSQGNPNLKAEIGRTFTAGAVYKPSFIPGLSLAVDYYKIKLSNAIQSLQGFDPNIQALCYDSGGTSPYCSLQQRPGGFSRTPANQATSNAVTLWITQNVNIAEISTYGIDGEINYVSRMFDRPFSVRLFATWQPHIIYNTPGVSRLDAGGAGWGAPDNTAAADLRINGMIHIEPTDFLKVDLRERFRGSMRYNANTALVFAQRVPSVAYTDATLTFKLPEDSRFEFYFNVQNLFDRDPPPFQAGTLPGQGFVQGDDYIGRYYSAGVRLKL